MTGDRSWLRPPPGGVDADLVRRWRDEADQGHREASLVLDELVGRSGELAAGLSVVIPSRRGGDDLRRCLGSLAAQTLDPAKFEIVLVFNGEPESAGELVEEFRRRHPTVTLRVLRLEASGASRARNAGIVAARREYMTFVDDDDYVSASFLATLLAHARPRVIPIASVVDVRADGEDRDNRINRALVEHSGRMTAPADLSVATGFNAAKAVATRLVQEVCYDIGLTSGEDVVFWMTVVARGDVRFLPCPTDEGAVYYRVVAPGSHSRPGMSFDFSVRQRLEVISRLDGLAGEVDQPTLELLDGRIRAQTGFIRDYLAEHPEDHGRVVTLLDRGHIERFPYHHMNTGLAPGLAIAYAFPPYADASAVVSAKRIRARGAVVDVVYNAMDSIRSTDEQLRRIAGPFVGREAGLRTPSYFTDWGSMEAFVIEGLAVIRRWQQARGPYRTVYSRAHFAASHLLAAAYKLENPAAEWTAEFSDPLSRDIADRERGTPVRGNDFLADTTAALRRLGLPVPRSSNSMVWCEELAYALADELLFTNANQMEYMLGYCTNGELAASARARSVIAPHPTLPADFYSMRECRYELDRNLVNLAYFGNFYSIRGFDDVLAALASCDVWTRSRVRIHVFTTTPSDLRRRAAQLGVSGYVSVGPYLRYLEFLNLTTRFDALIVNDAVTTASQPRNPYLPSKWSDYRGSGALVWGLVEVGSPLSAQPLDVSSPVGDVSAARDVLSGIVGKKMGAVPGPPGRGGLEPPGRRP